MESFPTSRTQDGNLEHPSALIVPQQAESLPASVLSSSRTPQLSRAIDRLASYALPLGVAASIFSSNPAEAIFRYRVRSDSVSIGIHQDEFFDVWWLAPDQVMPVEVQTLRRLWRLPTPPEPPYDFRIYD